MIRNHNCRFALWQHIARHGDPAAVEDLEDALYPVPDGEGDEGRGVVDPVGEEVADGEEEGE